MSEQKADETALVQVDTEPKEAQPKKRGLLGKRKGKKKAEESLSED